MENLWIILHIGSRCVPFSHVGMGLGTRLAGSPWELARAVITCNYCQVMTAPLANKYPRMDAQTVYIHKNIIFIHILSAYTHEHAQDLICIDQ